jgi:hypothetical protein
VILPGGYEIPSHFFAPLSRSRAEPEARSKARRDALNLKRGYKTPILLVDYEGSGVCRVGHVGENSSLLSDGVRTKRDTIVQDEMKKQLAALIECYRSRCLWFLAGDFVPETPEQAIHVLEYIERYGDREGFVQARRLKQWLSRSISEESVS